MLTTMLLYSRDECYQSHQVTACIAV